MTLTANPFRYLLVAGLLLADIATAEELSIEISGLKERLQEAVTLRTDGLEVSGDVPLSSRRLNQIVDDAKREVDLALRPYGYYHSSTEATLTSTGEDQWRLDLDVTRGPGVKVVAVDVNVTGPGQNLPELQQWRRDWPLKEGKVLNQATWEEQKQAALDLADADGYLLAEFSAHAIAADLIRNEARLTLTLETGPQAVMGDVTFEQDLLRPGILELLPRFRPGQPYDAWLLEKFRLDLWRTGYFNQIDVIEERRLEADPPQVNLVVSASPRLPNTYQGSLGFGTDTQLRAQVLWNRHLISSRGDSMDVGLGWQQRNEEYSFKTSYRLPRQVRARKFWVADFSVRKENQDLEVKANDDDPDFIKLTNGDVIDYSTRVGQLIVRDRETGYEQIFETWYAQYVVEKSTFSLRDLSIDDGGTPTPLPADEEDFDQFRDTGSSLALGVNWDWPVISGNGFSTVGHHERVWIFTANKAWSSEQEFTQAYISSNWHRLLGQSWKLLVRGEVGYSNADVAELQVVAEDQPLLISSTDLPNLYRFKAGGSRSVRGYAFESLSNNGLGSNNIVTASAEVEYKFLENWSAAAFIDVGNAFNDWSETRLKRGVGLGIRWYSIAGPVRLDIAQALDIDGSPWRIHFTIGTPLL